jgi:hypothetical protein
VSQAQSLRQQQAVERVSAWLCQAVTGLSTEQALAVLTAANATRLRPLYELDAWVAAHPEALSSPGTEFPTALERVADQLHAMGHAQVTRPACAVCFRVERPLRNSPRGRICGTCAARDRVDVCVRCGRTQRIMGRRTDGRICGRCRSQERDLWRTCIQCGRLRPPAARRADGAVLCQTCVPLPVRTCTRCSVTGPTHYNGPGGALCATCYKKHRSPTSRCTKCGTTARIAEHGEHGERTCYRCYRRPVFDAQCTICGRQRPCHRHGLGQVLMCRTCLPAPTVDCARCGRSRRVAVNWPMGPVCRPCYRAVLRQPGTCSACGHRRHLIARDDAATVTVCGPCAGAEFRYTCRICHTDNLIFADGMCVPCVTRHRLEELLTGPDGTVAAQLQPLLAAVASARNPASVLRWLHDSPTARLLASIAASGRPVAHEALDQLPPSLSEFYARNLLVHVGVLPHRLEHIERIQTWLHHLLQSKPAHHARLLRPFVTWHLLRRARRNARRRTPNSATAQGVRAQALIALKLLRWLDHQCLTLETLTQDQLDTWLLDGPLHRRRVATFIKWAANRGLTTTAAEHAPRARTAPIMPEHERWQHIRRCLTDADLPLEPRVGGALVLLYGITAQRIVSLSRNRIIERRDRTFLLVGRRPLLLPPSLAALVHRLRDEPTVRSGIAAPPSGPDAYLFPGILAGQHLQPAGFYKMLRHHGIPLRTAQPAALIALTGDLPTPVVADLLGIHVHTAQQWADYQRSDWAIYLASRTP